MYITQTEHNLCDIRYYYLLTDDEITRGSTVKALISVALNRN